MEDILSSVDRSGLGVYVKASTLGSLEALLEFLRTSNIPVAGIGLGPIHRKDVTKCSTMLERNPDYAVILAFDVPTSADAAHMANQMGVTIFSADIIYHLFDMFTDYIADKKQRDKVCWV